MSKQRALELCDKAEKRMNDSMANCAISCLCDAIRELAKDDPDIRLKLASYFKELQPNWCMSYCEAVACDILRIVNPNPSSSACGGVP